MQYYYECLEVYEKLIPEIKKHCKIIRKFDAKFLVMREKYLEALAEIEDKKEHMPSELYQESKEVIDAAQNVLIRITNEKWRTANSLMITVEYHLSRINGYVREFKCEIDSESPGTSIEIEKKFMEANRKRVKEIQELREEYPFLDTLFLIPQPEPEVIEPVPEPVIDSRERINGTRQNIVNLYQNLVSSFSEDPPGIRSSSKKNSSTLKIKTERRGSINGTGSPSPIPKTPRYLNPNDPAMLTIPDPTLSSNSVSPNEVSPGPHGNLSFSYSDNNLLQNSSFSTMPSFSGSQESRHGRQRKFTQKAQQMFKENKLGPGRPSNHLPLQFSSSSGTPEPQLQIPQFNNSTNNNSSNNQNITQQQLKNETPTHPIASSSYSFQDYSKPVPTSQQQYTFAQQQQQVYTPQIATGAPQMPLQQQQQQQNAAMFPQQQQQQQQHQQPFFRSRNEAVRLSLPNGNNDNINGDGNEEDQEEDDREWCFCGEHSYGEMIECDNRDCPYKWFHYQCIGLAKAPVGKWFCAECQNVGNGRS